MLMFATEFPARAGSRADDVLAIAMQWLFDSPHHSWQLGEIKQPDSWQKAVFKKDGERVEVTCIDEENYWTGFKHVWTEANARVWTTEIISRETPGELIISVRLFCDSLVPGPRLPLPKKPYILKALIRGIGGGMDGELLTSDQPIVLDDDDLDLAADIVRGNSMSRLPVIYVSAAHSEAGFINSKALARWMSCIAHVVVEPSREFNERLADYAGVHVPYDSAVAVYWSRGTASRKLLVPSSFVDGRQMATAISVNVRRTLTFVRPSSDFVWAFLMEMLAEHRVRAAKSTLKEDHRQIQSDYETQIEALKERLGETREENVRLREEVQRAASFGSSDSGNAMLQHGKEMEFYRGEHADIVLDVLGQAVNQLLEGSRKRHVVEDIVEANPASGHRGDLDRQLRSALSGMKDVDGQAKKALARIGFEIDESAHHPSISFHGDPRYTFTVSKTSSDHRGTKNLISTISRTLFK